MIIFQINEKQYTISTQQVSFAEHPLAKAETRHIAIAISGDEKIRIPQTAARTINEAKLLGYLNIVELLGDETEVLVQ